MSTVEDCLLEETAYKEAIESIKADYAQRANEIIELTKEKTEELTSNFEYEQDLASGVATTAGASIGGALGGPVGATVGGAVGNLIGDLFIIKIGQVDHKIVLTLPAVTMNTTSISFDTPSITMEDQSIYFNFPEPRMTRQKVGERPEYVHGIRRECTDLGFLGKHCVDVPTVTIRWKPIYADVPTIEIVEKRVVITMPVMEMVTQEFLYDMPTVELKDQEFIFSVPSITIEFVKDAGEKLSNEIKNISAESEIEIEKLNASMTQTIKTQTTPLLLNLMHCKRGLVVLKKKEFLEKYDLDIEKVKKAISDMRINNVPEEDDDIQRKKSELETLLLTRNVIESQFNEALRKFDEEIRKVSDTLKN